MYLIKRNGKRLATFIFQRSKVPIKITHDIPFLSSFSYFFSFDSRSQNKRQETCQRQVKLRGG